MKKNLIYFLVLLLVGSSCQQKQEYDPSNYYDLQKQDMILSRIIAHIFTPPLYVSMEDRLKPEHKNYYLSLTPNFKLLSLRVDKDGTHYFLVERPAPGNGHRVVGGSFKMDGDELISFKEKFVTPSLSDSILSVRSNFLFKEWMKGDIDKYLKMPSYVQWPNEGSYYDTITYEWKLKIETAQDSIQ